VSAEQRTATFAKPVLQAGVLSVDARLSIVYGVFGALAWWLFWIF